jgi:hypothetical protein
MLKLFGPHDATKDIFDRYLDEHFYVAAAGNNAPSTRQVARVAKKLGCRFPKEFVVHSTGRFGGAYVEVKEEFWPRPEAYEVGPFWSFLYGLWVFGFADGVPDWMSIELGTERFRHEIGSANVPCLKIVGDADLFAFTEAGAIVQWHHETGEFTPFMGGFFALFEQQVKALRERKDQKLAAARLPGPPD